MYVDKTNLDSYKGMVVYKTFNPKKLFIIEDIAEDNSIDTAFWIKDADGIREKCSSLRVKSIDALIEDTETKLNNHKARLWNFKSKLRIE